MTCRCNCGYRCGGPGQCSLGVFECLQRVEGHFAKDCDHDWSGPEVSGVDFSSATCAKCAMPQISHDMAHGP